MRLLVFGLVTLSACFGQKGVDSCKFLEETLGNISALQGPSNPGKEADVKVLEMALGPATGIESNRLGGLTLSFSFPGCVGQAVLDVRGLLFTTRFEQRADLRSTTSVKLKGQLLAIEQRIGVLEREITSLRSVQEILLRQAGGPQDVGVSESPLQQMSTATDVSNVKSGNVTPSYTEGTPLHQPGTDIKVRGYTRKDGVYVPPHTRSRPRK